MAAPIRFLSGRNQQQKIGIEGSTENQKVLEVVGRVGIGTTIFEPTSELEVRGDIKISGILTAGNIDVSTGQVNFSQLNVSGVSTFTGAIDANGSLDVDGHTELDDLNVSGVSTFAGAIDANGSLDVDGHTELDDLNVSGVSTFVGVGTFSDDLYVSDNLHVSGFVTATRLYSSVFGEFTGSTVSADNLVGSALSISGLSTFTGAADFNGSIDVDGQTELDDVNISGILTATTLNVTGGGGSGSQANLTNLSVSGVSTFTGAIDANGGLDVSGGSGLVANTAKISDLTDNRVVIAGNSGELEDSANLTFDGTKLAINGNLGVTGLTTTQNLNVTGVSTFVGLVTVTTGDVHISNRLFVGGLEVEGSGSENTFTGINTFTNLLDNTLGNPNTGSLNVNGGMGVNKNVSFGSTLFVQNAIGIGSAAPIGKLDVNGHTELDNVNVSGAITATTFTGNLAGTVNTAAQTNITSLGTLSALTVSGDITANGNIAGDNSTNITGIAGVTASTLTGTLQTAAQTNVTSVGTLSALTVSGDITANGNIAGDNSTNITGIAGVTATTLSGTLQTAAQTNVTSVGTLTGLDVNGHTELDNVNASGISSAIAFANFDYLQAPFNSTVTLTVTVASKDSTHRYNGTGSGNGYVINGIQSPFLTLTPGRTYRFTNDNTGSHPLKFYLEADKTTEYTSGVNFQNTYTEIIIGDETPVVLHYQCTAHGYMGNAIQVNSNVVNTNYAAILRGGLNVSGSESVLSSATVSDLTDNRIVVAGTSGVLEDSANLTFDGSTFNVTGHTELDNVNVSGVITATTFTGNLVGTVNTAAQPNITSVGTLSALTVSGDITANGNIAGDNSTNITGIAGVTATTLSGTLQTAAQTNVTSLGTLSALTVSGDITANGNIAGDNSTNITGIAGVTATTLSGTLQTAAQTNITSVGTLSSLVASTAKVSDLTDNRIVIAGASGELEDSSKLTFDGSTLTIVGDATFTGNVSIAGTLTKEDVTDIDSIGIVTARTGVRINSGGLVISSGIATFTDNIIANGNIVGDNSTNITGIAGVTASTLSGTLQTAAQTNVTSVGTLGALTVSGDITANGNIAGDGSTNITGIAGVTATTLSGTLQTAAQTNVTSVGTLGALTVSGDITANGNIVGDNSTNITGIAGVTATSFSGSGVNLTALNASNLGSGTVPDARFPATLPTIDGSNLTGLTASQIGALRGITINEEGSLVGTANSVSSINFVSSNLTATASGAGATITITDTPTFSSLNVTGITTIPNISGVTTFANDVIVGTGITFYASTGIVSATAFFGSGQNLSNLINQRIEGLQIFDEGVAVGTGYTFAALDVVGSNISISAVGLGTTARITVSDTPTFDTVTVTNNITANGNIVGDNSTDISGIDEITATGTATLNLLKVSGSSDTLTFMHQYAGASDWHFKSLSSGQQIDYTFFGESNHKIAELKDGGSVDLYYDNSKKFETTSSGVSVTGTVAATTFSGALSGNATSATTATTATNVTVADESSDTTCFPLFATAATGDLAPKSGTNLTFNSSTGALTATSFSGPLSGIATGATKVYVDESEDDNATYNILFTDENPGGGNSYHTLQVDNNGLTFNPNLNVLGVERIAKPNLTPINLFRGAIVESGYGINVVSGVVTATAFSGSGASLTAVDAATLDGVDSTSFLRSDAADTKTSGNLTFSDDVKAIFGTGGDLEIYHDGSHSHIKDTGTGNLMISASGFNVANAATNETMISAVSDGAVGLYWNNSLKLETASGGIDVTGTVTATTFSGALSGNATSATTATNVTVTANNSANENVYLLFVDGTTGSQGAETDSALSYNPSTNILSGNFSGDLIGTVQTAAQTNITSLGTLTSLTVSGDITANGNIAGDNSTNITGINQVTATTFSGSGASLTAVDAATLDSIDSTSFLRSDAADSKTSGNLRFNNSVEATFGTSDDLRIYHASGYSYIIQEGGNDLVIEQTTDNEDIVIKSDDGSGSTTNYFLADGSTGEAVLYHYGTQKLATKSGGVTVTGTLTATTFSGSGASLTSLPVPTTITVADESSDTTCFPLFATAATGDLAPKSGTNLTFNSSTGALTATSFVGPLTGNADTATTATNVTVTANNSTDETVYPVFVDGATGAQGAESDTGLNYNPSTGNLTATKFTGDGSELTGIAAGGSGEFNTGITSSRQIVPLSFESTVFTFPSTAGRQYTIESINVANVDASVGVGTTVNIIASIEDATAAEQTYIAYNVPIVTGGLIELLKNPIVAGPSDVIKMWSTNDGYAGVSNATEVYMSYSEFESTDYISKFASTASITSTDTITLYTSTSNPTVIEKIGFANRTDTGDFPISIKITNGTTTSYLAKDLIIPRYSTVDILDRPKRIETGAKIEVEVGSTSTVDVIISGKKITS